MKKLTIISMLSSLIFSTNALAKELQDPTHEEGAVVVINNYDCEAGLYDPTFCNGLVIISDVEQVKSVNAPVMRLIDPTFEPGAVVIVEVSAEGVLTIEDPTFGEDAVEIIEQVARELEDPTFADDAVTVVDQD